MLNQEKMNSQSFISTYQLKDKVKSIGKKTEEKTKELKDKSMQTMRIGPAKDTHDIQALDLRS
jgi:hypothetical protein